MAIFNLLNLVSGNPGALQFVNAACYLRPYYASVGFAKMEQAGIVGSKLYMLWNDCCNRDTALAIKAMCHLDNEHLLEHINYDAGRGIPISPEEVNPGW